jgi:hypothetical protein
VDPVTATLPLLPDTVHSGATSPAGAAVGQAPPAAGVTGEEATSVDMPDDEVEDLVLESQALRPRTSAAPHATKAMDDDMREEITPSRYSGFFPLLDRCRFGPLVAGRARPTFHAFPAEMIVDRVRLDGLGA